MTITSLSRRNSFDVGSSSFDSFQRSTFTRIQALDPGAEQLDAGFIDDRAGQRRHLSPAALRHAPQQNRSIGRSGRNQPRVFDSKSIVQRPHTDEVRPGPRRREPQFHGRVAPAGSDVALRTVRVQVRAHALFERAALVVRIGKRRILLGLLQQPPGMAPPGAATRNTPRCSSVRNWLARTPP